MKEVWSSDLVEMCKKGIHVVVQKEWFPFEKIEQMFLLSLEEWVDFREMRFKVEAFC